MTRTTVDELGKEQRAVFYLGLSEFALSVIRHERHDESGANAIRQAWRWVGGADVKAKALLDLNYADDETGIAATMLTEADPLLRKAWGCVGDAMAFVAYCAYRLEGAKSIPDMAEIANTPDTYEDFMDRLSAIIPSEEVAGRFADAIKGMRSDEWTRENVREVVYRIARECGVAVR